MAPCRPEARNWANEPSAPSARPLGNRPPMADSWSATSPTVPACPWSCPRSTSNWFIGHLRWVGEVVVVVTVLDHRHTGRQVRFDRLERGAGTEVLGGDVGDLRADRAPRLPRGGQDEPRQLVG